MPIALASSRRPVVLVAGVIMVILSLMAGGLVLAARVHPAVIGVVTAHGTTVSQVRVASGDNPTDTTSSTFSGVPGAKATITVPAGTSALLVAHFSATSECLDSSNTTGGPGCEVRILIGGVEANPTGSGARVFDSSARDGREAHAIERFRGPVGPGTYSVVVQYAGPSTTSTFWIYSWMLEVDRVTA